MVKLFQATFKNNLCDCELNWEQNMQVVMGQPGVEHDFSMNVNQSTVTTRFKTNQLGLNKFGQML